MKYRTSALYAPEKVLAEGAEGRLPEELGDELVAPNDVDLVVLDGPPTLRDRISRDALLPARVDDVATGHAGPVDVRAAGRRRHRWQVLGVYR